MAFSLSITNRQRAVALDLAWIRHVAEAAKGDCLAALKSRGKPLAKLSAVEATIVSDKTIARVHGEFFEDPTPTDVITFQHGEIILGAGTIAENALRYGQGASDEAALCVIHGLLHLAGWDDLTKGEARQMARKQEQIFKKACRMV
jgi:probable rRNA maturation factor